MECAVVRRNGRETERRDPSYYLNVARITEIDGSFTRKEILRTQERYGYGVSNILQLLRIHWKWQVHFRFLVLLSPTSSPVVLARKHEK